MITVNFDYAQLTVGNIDLLKLPKTAFLCSWVSATLNLWLQFRCPSVVSCLSEVEGNIANEI